MLGIFCAGRVELEEVGAEVRHKKESFLSQGGGYGEEEGPQKGYGVGERSRFISLCVNDMRKRKEGEKRS